MKYIALSLMLLACSGCTKPDKSKTVLENAGLTNIEITGFNFLSCSEDDFYKTGFTATGINGNTVKGTVCAGILFKGATIRYE